MTQEIADFVKTHKAKQFLKDVKAPTKEKKSGDVGGLKLGTRDPESDKLAAKHTREIHGSREGNKDPKDGVKDSLDDPKNKRLKGHGRNEMGDPMYEGKACGESGSDKDDLTVKKGKRLLFGDKLKEDTLANQIAVSYLSKRLNERSIVSGEHDVGCNPPDYTVGMETGKKPDAELQTDSKPITGKNEKSKKQNYKYGEVKK
jgi:hypothetical protein